MEDSPMSIWTEKMNVGFAWSLAPKWFCLIAVMQCASNAIAIGTQGRSPALFVRGSLKRVNSEDLWVLTCNDDVVDPETVSKEDVLQFYLYINSLPKDYPDALFLVYYEYLI
uniref:Uncharacterized protein n=1 Tax=Fagus sylvatica TaxID=28930 RepID=A0A2N9H0B3_FAGSY